MERTSQMKSIKIEEEGPFLKVQLNRPNVRNAFDPGMIRELTETVERARQDSHCRAIVITGAGPSFCAGADLNWMKSMADFSYDENLTDARELFNLFQVLHECPIPIFSRVHGNVMGGGVGLLAVSDWVAADAETVFALSEVRLGLVPAVIGPFLLQKVSMAMASDWVLTGRPFTAEEARQGGLVNFVGTAEQVKEILRQRLESLTRVGPMALRKSKQLLRWCQRSRKVKYERWADHTTELIADRRVSAEGQEGLAAFLEKRDAIWPEPWSSEEE